MKQTITKTTIEVVLRRADGTTETKLIHHNARPTTPEEDAERAKGFDDARKAIREELDRAGVP